MSGQRPFAPCGTKSAKDRHRRHGETCDACAPKPRPLKPCGTPAAYKRGCRCEPCTTAHRDDQRAKALARGTKPVEPLPCGTRASFKRGCRCGDCTEANRAYDAARRERLGIKPRTTMSSAEVIHEIEFLLKAGEGSHRILTATGYTRNPHSLKDRLRRAGRTDLTDKVLRMEEMAAA